MAATKNSRPVSDERYVDRYDYYGRGGVWKTIVRDASWHPSAPVIAATSWNGWDHGLGTCTVHSWSDGTAEDEIRPIGANENGGNVDAAAYANAGSLGASPMGARVTAQLQHDARYYGTTTTAGRGQRRTRTRNMMGLGALWGDDDGDEGDEDS